MCSTKSHTPWCLPSNIQQCRASCSFVCHSKSAGLLTDNASACLGHTIRWQHPTGTSGVVSAHLPVGCLNNCFACLDLATKSIEVALQQQHTHCRAGHIAACQLCQNCTCLCRCLSLLQPTPMLGRDCKLVKNSSAGLLQGNGMTAVCCYDVLPAHLAKALLLAPQQDTLVLLIMHNGKLQMEHSSLHPGLE